MLDNKDKKWICDAIDKRIDQLDRRLTDEIRDLRLYLESTNEKYWKVVSEYMPDAGKSFGMLEEKQQEQDDEILSLRDVARNHAKRINTLEDVVFK